MREKKTHTRYTCQIWSSIAILMQDLTATQPNTYLLGIHFLVGPAQQLINRQHAILTDGCEYLQPREHE